MNSIRIIVFHILFLSVTLASDICPKGQYLNRSDACVTCSSCHPPKNVIVKRCHGRVDTICGTNADLLNKTKKLQSSSKNVIPKKSSLIEKQDIALFERPSSYEFMLHGPHNKSRKNNDVVKVRNIKSKGKKNDSSIDKDGLPELPTTKFSFDKNGKHIKKDLSTVDKIYTDSNQSSFQYDVELNLRDGLENTLLKKNKLKQKKTKNNDQLKKDDEWMRHVVPHVENHQIYVDIEEEKEPQHSSENTIELKKTLATVLKAAAQLKNKTKFFGPDNEGFDVFKSFNENDGDYGSSHLKNKSKLATDFGDFDVFKRMNENIENTIDDSDLDNKNEDKGDKNDQEDDDDDDDPDDEEEDDDDDDEDDDDENENDEDDEDDGSDDDGTDENKDEDDDEDDDDDDEDFDASSIPGKSKTKYRPFGVDQDTPSIVVNENADDVESEEFVAKNKKWPITNEVNVEPFIDTSNWQLLILVSAVSACLLFFVVVNAYLCIYMKKWRHMKQDFEADVEDLSVRINLMQHAGFEADESSNMKNYITQLKGGKCTEKMSKFSRT